ncbi:hypothetical protein PsB1_1814 [Candidatus Phycosocius spiralis]|uniref:Uncharacterized protein n=1 Tax=Candidatus Phycosocius spiralis TaxID=2815099 RepID=A0ABQ4PXE5_9PROT|nr:hypothetical protein PsB1_1814 [Candidatus Phycosocius spiralis]
MHLLSAEGLGDPDMQHRANPWGKNGLNGDKSPPAPPQQQAGIKDEKAWGCQKKAPPERRDHMLKCCPPKHVGSLSTIGSK